MLSAWEERQLRRIEVQRDRDGPALVNRHRHRSPPAQRVRRRRSDRRWLLFLALCWALVGFVVAGPPIGVVAYAAVLLAGYLTGSPRESELETERHLQREPQRFRRAA